MNTKRPIKKCSESRVVRTNRIFPNDLNNNNKLFGGTILSLIDISASISVAGHTRKAAVTASMDSVDFINPADLEDSICAESFISGVGNSSVEVFCKVIAENLMTGERRLCATAFTTFTCFEEDGSPALVPLIEPETEEERYIHEGYPARRKKRLEERQLSLERKKNISLDIPWMTKKKD